MAVLSTGIVAAAGTLTGTTLASNVVASSLTSVGVLGSPHMTSAVVDSGGITVTGNSTITGTLGVTGNTSLVTGSGTAATLLVGSSVANASYAALGFNGSTSWTYRMTRTALNAFWMDTTFDGGGSGIDRGFRVVLNPSTVLFSVSENGAVITTSSLVVGGALSGVSTLATTGKATTYNNVSTAGWGVAAVYGSGRSTAQTAAVSSVAAYTVGAADGSFLVSMNCLVTTSTTHSFTLECAYTDEGNTARTVTFNVQQLAGTLITAITNVTGAGPYEGVPLHIRAKASTSITLRTQAAGTYTTVTFNVEGAITQIA